jgi:signal transduction histidine kinase
VKILKPGPAGGHEPASAPLRAVVRTEELKKRTRRVPDYETENRALSRVVEALAESPRKILDVLANVIIETLCADSAGISLLTDDGKRFSWVAIAGAWSQYLGGGTPRDFGPCGDVIDRDAPMLFTHPEMRYPYLCEAVPFAEEALLVPFHFDGNPLGTIWAILHDGRRQFDREDLRQLESLGRFASAAHQAVETNAALRRSYQLVQIQEKERRRLARELHDEIGQDLTAISFALRSATGGEPESSGLGQALRLTKELIDKVRVISRDLRPAMLDDLGLLMTLCWHFDEYSALFNIKVNFKHTGLATRRFPSDIEIAAYRIVQEALTNVARHAAIGHAAVEISAEANTLRITICDRGAGFEANMRSIDAAAGISGMKERAAMLGGSLRIESAPGEGTRVIATIPLGDGMSESTVES